MSRPIHIAEFATALGRCLPAFSNPVIAVANSAGPDSTCLLFLLRQLFPPAALLSLHVAHDLQSASPHMADTAAANATALGVPHHTAHVPWDIPPFPPVPTAGPFERTARDARYNILFTAMTRACVSLLALGHHADDQLETAVMRLACGSTLVGAAGMRPLRRWGMGSWQTLTSVGHLGMNAFVLRPLLSFPKDRILATCHAHHLRYVDDPTNFQPHLTPRNAIRRYLCKGPSNPVTVPPKVEKAVLFLHSIASDGVSEKQRLYSAVSKLATRTDLLDRQVTHQIHRCTLPSPIGTLLLSSSSLLGITDPDVRSALVLRAIRYVSFHPWGSPRADADRRQSSVNRIVRALWAPDPQTSQIKRFTAGGGVLWTPAMYSPNRPLRVGNQCLTANPQLDEHFCWLASRTPPFSKNPHQQGAGSPTLLLMDLTDRLTSVLSSDEPAEPLRVLYDHRFLLRIDPSLMPTHVKSAVRKHDKLVSIKVLPFTRYYWPKVVLQRASHPDQVLAVPQINHTVDEGGSPSWISIRWIRPLGAT